MRPLGEKLAAPLQVGGKAVSARVLLSPPPPRALASAPPFPPVIWMKIPTVPPYALKEERASS